MPPPPPGSGGRGTLAGERGVGTWESPNSDEGTYTEVLFIYTYFVVLYKGLNSFFLNYYYFSTKLSEIKKPGESGSAFSKIFRYGIYIRT